MLRIIYSYIEISSTFLDNPLVISIFISTFALHLNLKCA